MKVNIFEVGRERAKVVVIDEFVSDPGEVVEMASKLAPFSKVENHYYPGMRELIDPGHSAFQYFDFVCGQITDIIRLVFGFPNFIITEAGFSLLTQRPEDSQLIQRIPHFDSLDKHNMAVIHYLSRHDSGGTGFYRHRRSGFELITEERYAIFRSALDIDLKEFGPPPAKYIDASTESFERIGYCEGLFNRLVIYQGSLLHSAVLPDDFKFEEDCRTGRLTGNIFLRAGGQTEAVQKQGPPL